MYRIFSACALLCVMTTSIAAQDTSRLSAVADSGQGAETFVLITGMLGGVSGFRRLRVLLVAAGYRVIVVDPYRLSLDSEDVSFAAMARRVDAVLIEHGVSTARVVGHAQGAGIALRLAAMAPSRVSALYFLDSGALSVNAGPTLSASLRLVPLITHLPGGTGLVRERFVHALRENAGRQEWLDAATQRAYTEPVIEQIDRVIAMALRLSRSREQESLSAVVGRVRAPIVVLIGAAPHPADVGPEELAALVPLGPLVRVERLAGVGHFPHEEAPNELLPFLVASFRPLALAPVEGGARHP